MEAMAAMVADPCHAVLEPGFHSSSEGILARCKTVFNPANTETSGFILWCPTYASRNEENESANMLYFSRSDHSNTVNNSTANPLGCGSDEWSPNGYNIPVGASSFVDGDSVLDARCIGACLRMNYTGRMDECAGMIAFVENLPADCLFENTAPSINHILQNAQATSRFGIDTKEVLWRPDPSNNKFKSSEEGTYIRGEPGAAPSAVSQETEVFSPVYIGFVWSGVSSCNDLSFEFYQNIEWRPETATGFVAEVPRTLHETGYIEKVVKYLDDRHPGWSRRIKDTVSSGLVKLAQTGVGYMSPSLSNLLGPSRSLPMIGY